jgi:hypothetical protein
MLLLLLMLAVPLIVSVKLLVAPKLCSWLVLVLPVVVVRWVLML